MIVYIVMIIISCFFCYKALECKEEKNKKIFQILSSLPFIIISAIRYNVGTDYLLRYKPGFETILRGKEVFNYELGFSLLNKLCLLFTEHYQSIFIVTSILINAFIFYAIYKKSDKPLLSILVYFVGAYYFESMNGVRQFLAMAILMIAFLYSEKGKLLPIILCGIMAYYIHNISLILFAAILFLTLLVKQKKEIMIFSYWYIIIAFFVILFFQEPILNCLYFVMKFTRFKSYINGKYDYGDFQIIPIIVNIASYIYLYTEYQKSKQKKLDKKILLNLQFVGVLLLLLTGINTLFLRISYMFTIFQVISVPYFYNGTIKLSVIKANLHKIEIKKIINNLKTNLKNIKIKINKDYLKNLQLNKIELKLPLIFVLAMYLISFAYINVFHNVEECLPYQTFFGSEINEKK